MEFLPAFSGQLLSEVVEMPPLSPGDLRPLWSMKYDTARSLPILWAAREKSRLLVIVDGFTVSYLQQYIMFTRRSPSEYMEETKGARDIAWRLFWSRLFGTKEATEDMAEARECLPDEIKHEVNKLSLQWGQRPTLARPETPPVFSGETGKLKWI